MSPHHTHLLAGRAPGGPPGARQPTFALATPAPSATPPRTGLTLGEAVVASAAGGVAAALVTIAVQSAMR